MAQGGKRRFGAGRVEGTGRPEPGPGPGPYLETQVLSSTSLLAMILVVFVLGLLLSGSLLDLLAAPSVESVLIMLATRSGPFSSFW